MPKPGKNYKWYVVAMLWWIAFFNYADRQAVYSVFPLLSAEFHLSDVQLGMLGSSFALVYGLCAPLLGSVADRVRRKTAILTGLQVWSVICAATALSRNFTSLLIFRAAEGLGESVYFPASMSLVSDYHGRSTRSRAMGTHQTSVYVGIIAGGYLSGLIAEHFGWRSSFVLFGSCGVLLGLVLHRFLIEPARGSADLEDVQHGATPAEKLPAMTPVQFLKLIVKTPTVMLLMAAFMCENFTAMVLFTWMPTYLYQHFHMSLAIAGLTATLYVQVTSMAGSPLGGWLADTLRHRTPGGRILTQAIGIMFEAPCAAWCALTGSVQWLIVGLLCWGLCKGLYEANIFAAVFDVIPAEARGTATGFMNMMGWLAGGSTAPLLVGYLSGKIGLSYAIAVTSLSYVIASVLLFVAAFFFASADTKRLENRVIATASV
ncbi:MAG: MFS transporter [Acidobacteriaceae bacterium]|nr:MFS transporter [Acidobacteriaceae bacterium]